MLKANPGAFDAFRKNTKRHSEQRTNLALLQLLVPFIDPRPTGLERRWEEMGSAERKDYVRLTLLREELLLRRRQSAGRTGTR